MFPVFFAEEEEEEEQEETQAALVDDKFDILFAEEDVILYHVVAKKPKKCGIGRLTLRKMKAGGGAPFLVMGHPATGKQLLSAAIPKGSKPSVHSADPKVMMGTFVCKLPNAADDEEASSKLLMFKLCSPDNVTMLKNKIMANTK